MTKIKDQKVLKCRRHELYTFIHNKFPNENWIDYLLLLTFNLKRRILEQRTHDIEVNGKIASSRLIISVN